MGHIFTVEGTSQLSLQIGRMIITVFQLHDSFRCRSLSNFQLYFNVGFTKVRTEMGNVAVPDFKHLIVCFISFHIFNILCRFPVLLILLSPYIQTMLVSPLILLLPSQKGRERLGFLLCFSRFQDLLRHLTAN